MTLPYGFGSLSSGGSFPSLSSSSWPTPSASRSVPSASSWSSDPYGSAAANYGQGIAAAANSGGNAWSLPSWSGSSGGASNTPSLSQFSQGSPLTGFFGSPAASGGGGTSSALSQFGQASPLSGFFGSGGNTAASNSGGFQPGGILGGAGQGSTPSWTSMFGGGGNTPSAGGAAGAAGGFQMPGGFGQGIFGVSPAAQSPTYASGGSKQAAPAAPVYNAQNGGAKTTGAKTTGATNTNSVAPSTPNQSYDDKMRAKYGDPKGAGQYGSPEEASWNAGRTSTAKNTLSYDTNNRVYGNEPAPTPKAATPAVVATPSAKTPLKPVGVTQKSTPVVQSQPDLGTAWGPQDAEKQRRDSGYYLG